ncbi:MAG: ester cyclase, partial [Actinobacteria bacterium]|nr:ester cyclase [Actinomycetota bacterium]
EELVRWTFGRINAHDIEAIKPLWRNTVEHFPQGTRRGADDIADYFNETIGAMPDDFHLEIKALGTEGDNVFVRWEMTGTFNGGKFNGIAPTGARIELGGMDHFVIRDGGIVSNDVQFDQMNFARQLGMLPEDGTLADKALKSLFNLKTRAATAVKR